MLGCSTTPPYLTVYAFVFPRYTADADTLSCKKPQITLPYGHGAHGACGSSVASKACMMTPISLSLPLPSTAPTKRAFKRSATLSGGGGGCVGGRGGARGAGGGASPGHSSAGKRPLHLPLTSS